MYEARKGEPPVLWDMVVRISHWTLTVVVIGNALLTHGGSPTHVWLGWIGMSVLLVRVVWGFVGPSEARFSAFPPHPASAIEHVKALARAEPSHYLSHNPAGAMMVYALWGTLIVVIGTGLLLTGAASPMAVAAQDAVANSGDWSTLGQIDGAWFTLSRETAHLVKEVHEVFANLMLILAFVHVGGVILESRLMRRNLVRAMLAGDRKQDTGRTA